MRLVWLALLPLLAAAVLVAVPVANADLSDEQALAERFAPVVRLVAQAQECGYGESYEPTDVSVLFDEPTVSLRGPWNPTDLIRVAPVESDLPGLYEYHLDFPGNALDPGCDYERWSKRLTKGRAPTVYAHVVSDPEHPGQLALQYWLYYVFNDWNNTHEGDWEMVQLVFDTDDPAEALSREPVETGYSQHEGAERADWGDDKLEVVDGTHPVVYPAAGSHANFYEPALHLGSSAEQGVGCDDTSGSSRELSPVVRTIPGDPAQAKAEFPWIAFEGRWGELQRAFFNGPTGPNQKTQWFEPIRWSEAWRDESYAVPAGGAFGTGATDFFCGAVAAGSNAVRRMAEDPLPVVVALLALLALLVLGISRATWRPSTPLRLAHRRAWGQILTAAARMYVKRLRLFVGIGLLFLPVSVLVTLLQASLLRVSSVAGIPTEAESGGLLVVLVLTAGTALTLLGAALVQAATSRALVEIDQGQAIGPVRAYRLALDSIKPLLGALVIAVFVVSLLATVVFLIPVAIWLAVRWALIVPAVELEDFRAIGSLRRSSRLVRGAWLKVGSLTIAGAALALAAGPLLGALLIFATNVPLSYINLIAGLVYVVTMPFVALATTYVYFDVRVREELEAESEPDELSAEIQLAWRYQQ
ncbi:MAG: hypothetical protein ACRDPV_16150 [Gaiellaceae bacterium]